MDDPRRNGKELIERELTNEILRCALEVHRVLGPGLLESVYEHCMCREMQIRKIPFQCQMPIPLVYKDEPVEAGFPVDLLIADKVIKSVDKLLGVHEAQLLTYLRLTGKRVGLLLNFNVPS
jgi:GxxExxY protein